MLIFDVVLKSQKISRPFTNSHKPNPMRLKKFPIVTIAFSNSKALNPELVTRVRHSDTIA